MSAEVVCDWCGNEGHAETDCPALEPNPVKASCIHLTNCDCTALRVERDTLTAENARLETNEDYFESEIRRLTELIETGTKSNELALDGWVETAAALRSLRAAVARVADATGEHIIGDEPWRAAFKALLALVPSDNSWNAT